MSAWLCSEEHINLLVNASENPREEDFKTLVKENLRSLKARYPGRDFLDEWIKEAKTFKFKPAKPDEIVSAALAKDHTFVAEPTAVKRVVATQIVKACDCYDYQACETDDYDKTYASLYVGAVRNRYARSSEEKGKLYDALLWGL